MRNLTLLEAERVRDRGCVCVQCSNPRPCRSNTPCSCHKAMTTLVALDSKLLTLTLCHGRFFFFFTSVEKIYILSSIWFIKRWCLLNSKVPKRSSGLNQNGIRLLCQTKDFDSSKTQKSTKRRRGKYRFKDETATFRGNNHLASHSC